MRPPGDILMVTTGIMLQRALAAADLLAAQGIPAGILHMHTVKPLDTATLLQAARGTRLVVTLEEHVPSGELRQRGRGNPDRQAWPRPACHAAAVAAR